MANADPIDISVVIPCLNEEANALNISRAVVTELARACVTYEIIFIDNSSSDKTVEIIKRMCVEDARIKLIVNNRNYGQMRSPTHAIYQTTGRAVIGICADFQDPPEMIGEFIDVWRSGSPIVLGVRRSEKTNIVLKVMRWVGYSIYSNFGDYRVIPNATGFGLYDRTVVDCLKSWRDPEPFFRGMLVESGYRITTIPYDRPERSAGKSKNGLAQLTRFAVSGLLSSSKKLLVLPLFLSLALFPLSIVSVAFAGYRGTAGQDVVPALIFAFGIFLAALNFLALGLMGEQIRLIFEMTRNAPLVVEKERVNF